MAFGTPVVPEVKPSSATSSRPVVHRLEADGFVERDAVELGVVVGGAVEADDLLQEAAVLGAGDHLVHQPRVAERQADLGLVDDLRQFAGAQHRHGVDDDGAGLGRRQPAGDHGGVVGRADQHAVAGLDAVVLDKRMRQPVGPVGQFLVGAPAAVADQRGVVAKALFDHAVGQFDGGVEVVGIVEAVELATQLIFTGVFDRFPKLQIFWAENNIGWIPYFYQQMDQTYKVNCSWAERLLGLPKLKKLPSEYLREHAHWGVFDDPIGIQLRHMVGVDKIMWSTDFPHIVTRWPKSRELVEEQFAGVPENEKRAILAGNAVKFFHLDAV